MRIALNKQFITKEVLDLEDEISAREMAIHRLQLRCQQEGGHEWGNEFCKCCGYPKEPECWS